MNPNLRPHARRLCCACLALLTGCAVGPDYVRPTVDVPAAYKEAGDWKVGEPRDEAPRGKWWEVFGDAELDRLEEQVVVSNQNVRAAEAQYRAAQALVAQSRSALFPTLGASGTANRASGRSGSTGALAGGPANQFNVSLDASWEVDLWGRVRRDVEASEASAQASAAELAALQLSTQATLAQNYFQLRVADRAKAVLDETVAAYQRSLQLVSNQYAAGIVPKVDVIQATTQLKSAQAQAIDLGITRAQLEHAIALLTGKAPANFAVAVAADTYKVPPIALGLPSSLLERRPDVAAAERRVAAANAQIGVAEAAYFPELTLSGTGGFANSAVSHLFTLPNRYWSVGASLAEAIFDAGRRRAQTEQARASHDAAVAQYRQAVLAALQEVEDNLVALRLLEQEAVVQGDALAGARESVRLTLNQYKAGTVSYLNVVTAQTISFVAERNALEIEQRRMVAAAGLVKALGGGWEQPERAATR
jgi:NodT family efflux transporter outer membrane factor (OMF) lipoprotein